MCIKYCVPYACEENTKNKTGTIIRPPPIPSKPAEKPAKQPVNIYKIISVIFYILQIISF